MYKILLIAIILFTFGCSDFDFVYGPSDNSSIIKKQTKVLIIGDDSSIINNYFLQKLGNPRNNPQFFLEATSAKKITASIVEKDATASKFTIEHTLYYRFYDNIKNCLVIDSIIKTESTYDSKSAGYSFGTDLSKKYAIDKNIQSNIERFLNNLNILQNNFSCKNED